MLFECQPQIIPLQPDSSFLNNSIAGTHLLLRLLLDILRGMSSVCLRRLAGSPLPQVALAVGAGGDGFIANRHGSNWRSEQCARWGD